MCNLNDVIRSSYGAADEIITRLYEYGGRELGNGVRRVADEAFSEGLLAGYEVGFDKGIKNGTLKGCIYTSVSAAIIGGIFLGTMNLIQRKRTKDLQLVDDTMHSSELVQEVVSQDGTEEVKNEE